MDRELFARINQQWTNTAFDWFFPRITDLHKDPVFVLAAGALVLWWIFRQRVYAAKWILVLVLSVGAADLISYRVIKQYAQRVRPAEAGLTVQLRTHSHSGTSFPSNHAANVFAAATVISSISPWTAPLMFLIAALVAYSRVYVGVHFPLDVAAGALLGISIALMFRFSLWNWVEKSAPWMKNAIRENTGPRRW